MRNLKNINHWIAEVRDIAIKHKLKNEDSDTLSIKAISSIFNKESLQQKFNDSLTPMEAFEEEIETWES